MSPSPSAGYEDYTKGSYGSLPTNASDLTTAYTVQNLTDISTINGVYVDQSASGQYAIHEYKNFAGAFPSYKVQWNGKVSLAPSSAIVYLQVYNWNSSGWETLTSNTSASAGADFSLTASIVDLTNYKDSGNIVTCRVYQLGTTTLSADYWFAEAATSYSKTHTTDTVKKITPTRTHTANTNKRQVDTIFHTTDSLKAKSVAKTHTTDALKRKAATVAHTTDANKRKATSVAHTTDTNKRKGATIYHTTDSEKRKGTSLVHTTDAVKRKASAVTHSTDALLSKIFSLTHTTDAQKRKASAVTHTTDTEKRKAFTKTHTADALKKNIALLTHTTSANKTGVLVKYHSTNALLWSYNDSIKHKNSPIFMEIGNGLFTIIGNQRMPTWDTLGRPATAKEGTYGFNFQTNSLEFYNGSSWFSMPMSKV